MLNTKLSLHSVTANRVFVDCGNCGALIELAEMRLEPKEKKGGEMMSDEAAKIDYCTVCLKRLPGPPINCFSRVCNDCRKMIERGQVDELIRGLK